MQESVMVNMMNPISWIGCHGLYSAFTVQRLHGINERTLRPHESINRNETQYPGMRPATERMI